MVWGASKPLALGSLLLRGISALLPLATLWVSKLIIDLVVRAIRHQPYDHLLVWKLLFLELLLALTSDTLGRFISLIDSLLGDLFSNHVSLRLMEHAAALDLVSFEDPAWACLRVWPGWPSNY
jgi:ATP-binding cassette subfamily B protein